MRDENSQTASQQELKATSVNGSVVYSFFHKWEEPLRAGRVLLFFRKRYPVSKPSRVYFYIGAPIKAIIGSAAVDRIDCVSKDEALLLAGDGCISLDELSKYIGHSNTVGALWIEDFHFFDHPIPASKVMEEIGLSPPQNFQKISADDEAAIRKLTHVA